MSKYYHALERAAGREVTPSESVLIEAKTLEDPCRTNRDEETEEGSHIVVPDVGTKGEPEEEQSPVSPQNRFVSRARRNPATSKINVELAPIDPAFERVIQRLMAFRCTPHQGVILIAGAVSGEGASTIARNTAVAIGRGQTEPVILVDANTRTPVQHAAFETELSDGLGEVLKGTATLTSAIKPDVSPGLCLLTAGRPIDRPSQLMTISALNGIMMALTSLFCWVIIDGPPVTTCPETASLADASGGAVLVIQAERTRQEVAEEATRVLAASGTGVLGAVLNRRMFHIPDFVYRRL